MQKVDFTQATTPISQVTQWSIPGMPSFSALVETPVERAVKSVDASLLPAAPTRDQIERLELFILQCEQVETPTRHYFAPGLYAREMFIPAGAVLTGAVHKTEHLAIFVGDITVWTEHGMARLTGHHTFVSKPGAKRVGYAHADTWCTGFFPTNKTDIAELESELVEDAERLQCNRPAPSDLHQALARS